MHPYRGKFVVRYPEVSYILGMEAVLLEDVLPTTPVRGRFEQRPKEGATCFLSGLFNPFQYFAPVKADGRMVFQNVRAGKYALTCEPDSLLSAPRTVRVTAKEAEEIVRARSEGGKFKDFYDFCERIDRRIVQKAAVEKMIKAGAFDCFGRRAAHIAALEKAFAAADEKAADRRRGQGGLFDDADGEEGEAGLPSHGLPDVPEWPETEKLKFEKEALDFYMSSHPLAQHDQQLARFRSHDCAAMTKAKHQTEGRVGGMIIELEIRTAANGRNMGRKYATFRIEDFTGTVRCILWSD